MGSTRKAGDLHCHASFQRAIGGFVVTDGLYPPALKLGRHDHELASLCIVTAGSYEEAYGQRTRRAEPGAVVVHPAGERHANQHDPVPVRLLTIEVEAKRLEALRPLVRVFDDAWDKRDEASAIFACRLRQAIRRDDSVSSLTSECLIMELLAATDCMHLPRIGRSPWLLLIRDYLEAHAVEAPSMERLSRLAGVHPVHLARAFRRAFGCSIGTYVRRLQVGRAMILLEDGALTLPSIAYLAGFSDQSHMTRLVRAQTGLTPGAWRGPARRIS